MVFVQGISSESDFYGILFMGFPGDLLELMGLNVLPALSVDH